MVPDWQTPAWQTPVSSADRVELVSLPQQKILAEEDWPDIFRSHVSERRMIAGDDAQQVIGLFTELEPGDPARCHMPPWGLAFYKNDIVLVAVTICYRCSNAYVYLGFGRDLRAFDSVGPNAVKLRYLLEQHLQMSE